MIKCELLEDCSLVVKKGSIVIVDELQFENARYCLKPIDTKAINDGSTEKKTTKKK